LIRILRHALARDGEAMPFQTRLLAEISAATNKRAARRILAQPQTQEALSTLEPAAREQLLEQAEDLIRELPA
jgi:hypothetical protein